MSREQRARPDRGAEDASAPGVDRRLRQAMLELCYERTLDGFTVGDLCRRAGVSSASFCARYEGLEACFHQLYAAEFGRYRRQAAAARAEFQSWRDRVRATAYALARFLAEDRRLAHFTVIEVQRAGESTQLLLAEGIEEMFDLLDQGRSELEDPGALTRATAESVGGGIFSQVIKAVSHGGLLDPLALVPQLMHAAVLPYLGIEAAEAELSMPPSPVPAG